MGWFDFLFFVVVGSACFGLAYCVAILGFHNWGAFLGTLTGVSEIMVFGFCGAIAFLNALVSIGSPSRLFPVDAVREVVLRGQGG